MEYFPHFSRLHTSSFPLTSFGRKRPTFWKKYWHQSLEKRMYMIFFLYQLNFQQFQAILGVTSDGRGDKFYWLPPETENTGCVLRSLRELVFSMSSASRFTLEYRSTSHGHLVSFFLCLPGARVSYFKLSQFV